MVASGGCLPQPYALPKKGFVGETELGYNTFYKTSIHNRTFGSELRASFSFAKYEDRRMGKVLITFEKL